MDYTTLVMFLAVGSVAGWLAGKIIKGDGYGLIGNMIVGIIGAFVGGFVFNYFEIFTGGMIGFMVTAVTGAVILLFFLNLIK